MSDAARWQQSLLDAITTPDWDDDPRFAANPLAVYRNNYRVGLMALLQQVYPLLGELLGKDFFEAVCREYVRATPSRSGNVHEYGATLADFLTSFPHTQQWPYLPDVARWEWAWHRGYYAANLEPFSLAELASIAPEQWLELTLTPLPSSTLLHSPWALSAIYRLHRDNGPADFTLAQDEWLLIWRDDGEMRYETLSAAAYAWLAALQQGHTLLAALDAALAIDAAFDFQPLLLQALQQGWLYRKESS